jgi:hypothetical protein
MSDPIWRGANISGTTFDKPWKWLLLPGVIIQWFQYMFPGRGFRRVVSDIAKMNREIKTPSPLRGPPKSGTAQHFSLSQKSPEVPHALSCTASYALFHACLGRTCKDTVDGQLRPQQRRSLGYEQACRANRRSDFLLDVRDLRRRAIEFEHRGLASPARARA